MLQGWPKVGPAKRDSFLGAAPTITVNYTLPRSEESYTAFIAGVILKKIAPQY
jgi:hypothetical protein